MMNRWVAIRLDFICILICFSCALSLVLLADVMPAALAGLGLSFALQVWTFFSYIKMHKHLRKKSIQQISGNCDLVLNKSHVHLLVVNKILHKIFDIHELKSLQQSFLGTQYICFYGI